MIGEQVKERIRDEWLDAEVANWVISQLPLLDLATKPACPILSVPEVKFLNQPSPIKRLVISGGLEGTTGHVKAFGSAQEARTLMKNIRLTDCRFLPCWNRMRSLPKKAGIHSPPNRNGPNFGQRQVWSTE